MQVEKLRSLIRESIQDYIKEIDGAAEDAAMEARISKCEEAIQMRETKLNAISESDHKDLMDEGKIKGLENEIKELKKAKIKFEKAKEKKVNKKDKKKEVVSDTEVEAPVDEADVMAEMDTTDEVAINESFLKMQKLAGVITESEYKEKTNEIFGFGSKSKFKDGDKVYIKVGGHDNSEWETEPRKISISRQKPYKDKRGMMYRVTTNPDKQGNFFTDGGLDVPEQNIKPA